jgi:capsular exopolysaccharide synthesis family protein
MADDSIDLKEYVAVVRRRKGIVIGATLATVALAAAYSFTRTPEYTARATVLVQPAIDTPGYRPDQLVSLDTEARIARSEKVARIADRTLASSLPIPKLLQHVAVQVTPDTLVLDVLFTDQGPRVAALGANAFAQAYLEYKTERAAAAIAAGQAQIQGAIDDLRSQLTQVEKIIDSEPEGSVRREEAQAHRDQLNQQITALTPDLVNAYRVTDAGEVILPAEIPMAPSSPKHLVNLAMGLFAGLFLGFGFAFARDRTDERVRSREALEHAIDVPVLATIPKAAALAKGNARWLVTERQPRSPTAEAYRLLRTSVMAASRSRGAKVFAVVSPMLGEGKTTTTANLAAALSHTDSEVLAVSADLRKPTLHRYFDRDPAPGLADVLQGRWPLGDALERVGANLRLLPSGDPPNRPAELLQSQTMDRLFAALREKFDFIIVDCPPVLGLADSLSIAPLVDAVILVARAESSKQGAIRAAVDQLEQVGAVIWGTVLNDAPKSKTAAYGYGYGYGYEDEGDGERGEDDRVSGRGGSARERGDEAQPGRFEPSGARGVNEPRANGAPQSSSGRPRGASKRSRRNRRNGRPNGQFSTGSEQSLANGSAPRETTAASEPETGRHAGS